MNYYGYSDKKSKYKGKKKLLWFNILLIVLIVLASVVFGLVLGNNLKKRLEEAEYSKEPVEITTEEENSGEEEEEPLIKNSRTNEEMTATEGYLDLVGCTSSKEAASFVSNLKSAGYTGIYFDAVNNAGEIGYASSEASSFVGGALSESLVKADILKAALDSAHQNGLRTTAHLSLSSVFSDDERAKTEFVISKYIIKELHTMGVSEVILSGIFNLENFTTGNANYLFTLISEIRNMCPELDIGIVMDLALFENPELTPTLELVFRYTDFFALDFTNAEVFTKEKIESVLTSLSGSFNAYCIRVLTEGDSVKEIQNNYAKISFGGYVNMSFVTPNKDMPNKEVDEAGNVLYKSKIFSYALVPVPETTETEDKT